MRRREFIAGIAGTAAAWPLVARAQHPFKIGYLGLTSPSGEAEMLASFREGLKVAGFEEGRDATIELRFAEGDVSRLPALADDLLRRDVTVLLAGTTAGGCRRQERDVHRAYCVRDRRRSDQIGLGGRAQPFRRQYHRDQLLHRPDGEQAIRPAPRAYPEGHPNRRAAQSQQPVLRQSGEGCGRGVSHARHKNRCNAHATSVTLPPPSTRLRSRMQGRCSWCRSGFQQSASFGDRTGAAAAATRDL